MVGWVVFGLSDEGLEMVCTVYYSMDIFRLFC